MAPTLATACAALPPGGAGLAWGGPALRPLAPTIATTRTALPPRGAAAPAARQSRFRGPCQREEGTRRKNTPTQPTVNQES